MRGVCATRKREPLPRHTPHRAGPTSTLGWPHTTTAGARSPRSPGTGPQNRTLGTGMLTHLRNEQWDSDNPPQVQERKTLGKQGAAEVTVALRGIRDPGVSGPLRVAREHTHREEDRLRQRRLMRSPSEFPHPAGDTWLEPRPGPAVEVTEVHCLVRAQPRLVREGHGWQRSGTLRHELTQRGF